LTASPASAAKCIPGSWVVAEPIQWYRRCLAALQGVDDEPSRGRLLGVEILDRELVLRCEVVVYNKDL
jgi:hypothetical protein